MSTHKPNPTRNFTAFADWCRHRDSLSDEEKHTVEVLLKHAGTDDYDEANEILLSCTELDLRLNEISDLKPLSSLTNLTSLTLNCKISDLKPLSSLTKLTYLNLYENLISDLKPLSPLLNLTDLSLDCNQINDISPLSSLTNLTTLGLSNNQINDISPLSFLTNLTGLCLGSNLISDLKPLSNLTNLTDLNLQVNLINDFTPLYSLTNLTELRLDLNEISDLTPVRSIYKEWRTLSTTSIDYQQALCAIKEAYAFIYQAEPEIVFCSSPKAGLTSLAKYQAKHKYWEVPLQEQLCQTTKERFSPVLWEALQDAMYFRLGQEIKEQQESQLGGDVLYQYNYLTPEDLVEAISLMEYCVSKFSYVVTNKTQQALYCLNQLLEYCGWIFPYEKVCFVCERPIKLSFDSENLFHALGKPALQFADGYRLYSYHGVTLPAKYGELHPKR
ncbi:leucine-rich repeat domain-containing protein [Trichocoleus sp. DQ-A3]|nr:leucine-rich repeat domain-containing protein [Coleofasciculus sp. FACHB-125]